MFAKWNCCSVNGGFNVSMQPSQGSWSLGFGRTFQVLYEYDEVHIKTNVYVLSKKTIFDNRLIMYNNNENTYCI